LLGTAENLFNGAIGSVVIDVDDAYGNVVATDGSRVTIATGVGSPLGGPTSVMVVDGVATFSNLSITQPGSHTLSATDGALGLPLFLAPGAMTFARMPLQTAPRAILGSQIVIGHLFISIWQ
jgi:hypothetical protein